MWEAVLLTLAATAGNNIGKVLQKKGTLILPPLSFKLKVIRTYAFNRAWISGFLMDIGGALLMLRALSLAPQKQHYTACSSYLFDFLVSVIQPVSGCGLAILSIFSHFYLKELMNVVDWMGIALAGIGTIALEHSAKCLYYESLPIDNDAAKEARKVRLVFQPQLVRICNRALMPYCYPPRLEP
uniref:Probable magnesium transporter n=1 Tax=Chenopodium quinoa TaxID=63459 RepID=A0A803N1Y4_CHEQI